jgi:protein-tyrosine-phosphatase
MARTRILFICIGNTCRSPMAEAIARSLGGDRVEVYSAGLAPTGMVAEAALTTLAAMGYPNHGLRSKGLEEIALERMDVIVSLLGPDGLKLLPANLGATREAWPIRDPFGEDEEVYRAAATVIESRIKKLLADLDQVEPFLC